MTLKTLPGRQSYLVSKSIMPEKSLQLELWPYFLKYVTGLLKEDTY
jgi:hypothetical protein